MIALMLFAAAEAACTSIVGGRVLTPSGWEDGATVVIDGGRLAATAPPGCAVIDATGRWVTPGLVEASSRTGLVEVDLEGATHGFDAGADPVRAAFRAADAYDPASVVVAVTRLGGVTSTLSQPTGGRIAGQAAWVDLAGDTRAVAVIDPGAAMIASLGGSRGQGLLELRELLADARFYAKNRAAWEKNGVRGLSASGLDLEALQPVLAREVPLVVGADRAADVEGLIDLAESEKIDVVIAGGAEAWRLADRLAAARIAVIVDPLVYGPGGFDQVHARPDNAAMLARAGVPVILSTFDTHNARLLRQSAGNAVRGGMAHVDAMRAITSTPATVFGVEERGTLEPGKVANVVLWSGDPLELLTRPEAIWIAGEPQPLRSRQTALYERYATLPGAAPE